MLLGFENGYSIVYLVLPDFKVVFNVVFNVYRKGFSNTVVQLPYFMNESESLFRK